MSKKIIKGSSKKGQELIEKSFYTEGYTLSDIYGAYSQEKINAYNYCRALYMESPDNYNFRIISHNIQRFSVAWDIINQETGEIIGIQIETQSNSYYVDLTK